MGYTGNNHHAQKYDATKAYDKDLSASARLHYLENSEHDKHAAKMYGDPPAKNITKVLSEGAKHNAAPKMYDDAAPKFNAGLRAASADGKLSGKFEDAVNAAPKMSSELSDPVLENDMRSNRMGGYAGDASGAPDPTRPNTSNDPAPMMKVLGKPALMMKKGIASMCGMKK